MTKKLWIDTETFSEADLKTVGAYAYAEHPSTEIMLVTYAIGNGPEQCYDVTSGDKMPRDLAKALRKCQSGDMLAVGQNILGFDRLIFREVWGIAIPVRNIIDTMVIAYRHALPGSLEALCTVLDIPQDLAKDKAGKALIQRFCKPTPKNYKVRRYTKETHPQEWRKFINYALSDITSLREVYDRLPKWNNTEIEDLILEIDQAMNDRGFYVDQELAFAAIKAEEKHKADVKAEARDRFGCTLTGQDFLPALRRALGPGFSVLNAQKATLNDLLNEDLPSDARDLIELRLQAASTAATKYKPLINGLSQNGRRCGTLAYGAAKRTLRWAGRKFQPQNLARGFYSCESPEEIEVFRKALMALKRGVADRVYDVGKLVTSAVRPCIIPAPGMRMMGADYSNVEGRGLAWAAGETTALEAFFAGLDIYCETAGKMFGLDPKHIKQHRKDLRQIGKACLHRHSQVLTENGFRDIMAITSLDKVWNGEKWVNTDGAKLMGWKPVITLDGIRMTEDHQILSSSWREAKQLASNQRDLSYALARGKAGWLSFEKSQNAMAKDKSLYNVTVDRCRAGFSITTCSEGKPHNVTPAPSKQPKNTGNSTSATKTPCPTTSTEDDSLTGYPRLSADATGPKQSVSKIMEEEEYRSAIHGERTNASFLGTFKQYLAGINQNLKWTERTTMGTMSPATFGLSAVRKTVTTAGKYPKFNSATMQPLPALLNWKGKLSYCEPVYDLINVSDGNRFLVKSDSGYLLAHNCELGLGYQGGVSAFLQFAKNLGLDLFEMAKVMDGTFPDHIWAQARRGYEFARIQEKNKRPAKGEQKANRPSYDLPKKVWMTCDSIKRMWRESHPMTVKLWDDIESAVVRAIKNPGKSYWAGAEVRENGDRAFRIVRTTRDGKPGWWLKIELPSGRCLSYPGIGLSAGRNPDTGETEVRIKYLGENQTTGQWGWQYSYGGKFTENVIQALCRDAMAHNMVDVEKAGMKIVLTVHDELVVEVPKNSKLMPDDLCRVMCKIKPWLKGFPLVAEGEELTFYRK